MDLSDFSDQKNIKVGDELSFSWSHEKYKVSAIVNDSQNGLVANPARIIYVNNNEI